MTSGGSNLLLVGLRESGKTSYLAALWHQIEAGELPTALVASQFQPDRQYLNQIREKWLRFEEVGRTSLRSQEVVSLPLRDSMTGAAIDVVLPDLSGELFRLQWLTRRATRQYAELAASSSGVLLFIHPARVKTASRIPSRSQDLPSSAKVDQGGDVSMADSSGTAGAGPSVKEWSSELAPTQVKLVELLQFVSFLRSSTKPMRIAVVVSAWDLVRDRMPPISWLEGRLPLLFQFLAANSDTVAFRVYGISALGGDLQKDLQRLQSESIPSRRIKVVDGKSESHGDLTAPIQFLSDPNRNRTQSKER